MAILGFTPKSPVREAHFAGTWYPGNSSELRQSVEGYMAQAAAVALPGKPLAIVCPHPGHRYGGQVAACAFAQVCGLPYTRVVLLGPLHSPVWGFNSGHYTVTRTRAYATPLGQVPLDTDFIAALAQRVPLNFVHDDHEHSLEIELPFLQVALKDIHLVPIMISADISSPGTPAELDHLAAVLAELADDHTLFVSSTDLTHLDDYAEVTRVDQRMVELVNSYDLLQLTGALARREVQACGATGLVTALRTAQLRGATGARVLLYKNSGDITGNHRPGNYTVGYMAAVAY